MAAAGGVLLYSGLKDVPVLDSLRSLLTTGLLPQGAAGPGMVMGPRNAYALGGSPAGQAIANAALKYNGKVPYKWGGATPAGWDCSGFVTYVLHHDLGYDLPSNDHTVCMQFYTWSGATAVRAPMAVQAGDLVVWPTHMGIAISPTEMISAENPSRGTRVDTFQDGGPIPYSAPTFLRVKSLVGVG